VFCGGITEAFVPPLIRHGRHCVFKLHVHFVLVAKYRRRVFDARAIQVLRGIFANVCSDAQATLVEMESAERFTAAPCRTWSGFQHLTGIALARSGMLFLSGKVHCTEGYAHVGRRLDVRLHPIAGVVGLLKIDLERE
jgi:transposase IS200 family protein